MATDATGTPTSPDSIPKFDTAVDSPSGLGSNAQMDAIQTALSARIAKTLMTTTGDIIIASAADTPARLAAGTATHVLTANGAGVAPSWQAPAASGIAATILDAKGDLIAASAADTAAKLTVGANNTVLLADSAQSTGLRWANAAIVYERRTALVDIASSASELTLYDGSAASGSTGWSIAAGDLSTNRVYRLTILGTYLFNNSGANTLTIKVKYGGSTIWQDNLVNAPGSQSATRHPLEIRLHLANRGVTNAQIMHGVMLTEANNAGGPTTGFGQSREANTVKGGALFATSSVDTTAATKFDVTATWSASSANNSIQAYYALSELL